MIRAGTPTATQYAGMSASTTDPAPTCERQQLAPSSPRCLCSRLAQPCSWRQMSHRRHRVHVECGQIHQQARPVCCILPCACFGDTLGCLSWSNDRAWQQHMTSSEHEPRRSHLAARADGDWPQDCHASTQEDAVPCHNNAVICSSGLCCAKNNTACGIAPKAEMQRCSWQTTHPDRLRCRGAFVSGGKRTCRLPVAESQR